MIANREGRFRASVTDRGVNESGPNNLCTVILRFHLTEEYRDGEWHDVSGDDLEIVAYNYVEKRDGSLNDFIVDALKEAFGWAGVDPFWFEDAESLPEVQVTLGFETYQGKERLRVRFINPYDSQPSAGVTHADASQRRAMTARLGSKLRAHSGGTPAPAPKPTGRPKPPPTQPQAVATMEGTWALFTRWAETTEADEAALHEQWFGAIKAVCGHEDAERVTPEQWAEIQTKVPDNPF